MHFSSLISFFLLLFTTRNKVQNHCKSKKNQILSNNKALFVISNANIYWLLVLLLEYVLNIDQLFNRRKTSISTTVIKPI